MTNESPYGHEHPVMNALDDWVAACEPYTAPDPGLEVPLTLLEAARKLNKQIDSITPHPVGANDLWVKGYHIRTHIRDLTAQFLFHEYTDSNTDEPCDVEWDVLNFYRETVDGSYQIPDEIRPAYVSNLYDGPPEDLA